MEKFCLYFLSSILLHIRAASLVPRPFGKGQGMRLSYVAPHIHRVNNTFHNHNTDDAFRDAVLTVLEVGHVSSARASKVCF